MLQELGVLGAQSEEWAHRMDALLEDMDSKTAEQVLAFAKQLKTSGRTDCTVTLYLSLLRALSHWLAGLDPQETLGLANRLSIECYLEFMRKSCSYAHVAITFRRMTAFYRWAKRTKLILQDPTDGIRLSRPAEKLSICSKTQFKQLNAFMRDPEAPAEQALVVALMLFFGLTLENLVGATVEIDPHSTEKLKIILTRKPRTRGRRYYNREQVLSLPPSPVWLKDLTARFCSNWLACAAKILPKASFPRAPLLWHPQLRHNRNMSDEYIRELIKTATKSATGSVIPPRVLRQTCGHIMTHGDDASALSRLGWSPQFAFHYTWLPRVQFQS